MDTDQWFQQGIGLVKGEESSARAQLQAERKTRPHKDQTLNCPRCNSSNTKFCYYNNYSLSQPRYFCKGCRRYWTQGGSLRNVPVGGGSRKNKRSSSSSSSSTNTATIATVTALPIHHATSKFYQAGPDLNLSFPHQSLTHELGSFPTTTSLSALELLRSGISARGLGPFPPAALYGAGFGFQETIRPSDLKQPLEGVCGGGYSGGIQEERNGGVLFPFEQLKQVPLSNASHEAQEQGDATFFWNGVAGNGGSGGGEGSW